MSIDPEGERLRKVIERQQRTPGQPSQRRSEQTRAEALRRREMSLAGYHQARLLILLRAVAGPNGKVDGLTKIAKLDFLLRYPMFLEELLEGIGEAVLAAQVRPSEAERRAVEARMIRYKYGPWDDRYYSIIGGLVGRGLLEYVGSSDVLSVRPTEGGRALGAALAADPAWMDVSRRVDIIKRAFGRMSGNRIKDLIYRYLPGVVDRPLRREI